MTGIRKEHENFNVDFNSNDCHVQPLSIGISSLFVDNHKYPV
jgi:hypothetical protein